MCDTLVVTHHHHKQCQPQYQVPHETFRELSKQTKVFKDILQRILLTARFEDATPPKCKIIHM